LLFKHDATGDWS